jgi:hypothetical protein
MKKKTPQQEAFIQRHIEYIKTRNALEKKLIEVVLEKFEGGAFDTHPTIVDACLAIKLFRKKNET